MVNIAIFASGAGTNAENLFLHFKDDKKIKFKIVVTNNQNAGIFEIATRYKKSVQVITKTNLETQSHLLINFLKSEAVDLIVLAGFLLKIPEAFIKAFPNQIINLHPSLLPKYGGKGMYGHHVHDAVLKNNEPETGITIHYVNEAYDEGQIILQQSVALKPNETVETVQQKIRVLEFKYLPEAIKMLASTF